MANHIPGEGSRRSTLPELILLIVTLVAFLAGTVWALDRAAARVKPMSGSGTAAREAAMAMDGLVVMLRGAEVFYYEGAAPRGEAFRQTRLDFLADLDGDESTGGYAAGGARGLERAVVTNRAGGLLARVYPAEGRSPSSVWLLKPPPQYNDLYIRYNIDDEESADRGLRVDAVRVYMAAGSGSTRVTLDRYLEFDTGVPLDRDPAL